MNVYSGIGRRQVGGNVWSTIRRGVAPFMNKAISKFKPFAEKIGKKLARKTAKHALNVGANLIRGKDLKEAVTDEGQAVKGEVLEQFRGMKRKLAEEGEKFLQDGKGYKRRRISSHCQSKKKKKSRKMPKRKARKTLKRKQKKVYKRARKTKSRSKKSTRKGRVTKRRGRKSSFNKKAVKDLFSKL